MEQQRNRGIVSQIFIPYIISAVWIFLLFPCHDISGKKTLLKLSRSYTEVAEKAL